ncbi:MAG: hypothetical protein K2Q45_06555 [Nitrosomonas sp.]|nr:hypothetical protein [Nitrosomonas sp.]
MNRGWLNLWHPVAENKKSVKTTATATTAIALELEGKREPKEVLNLSKKNK